MALVGIGCRLPGGIVDTQSYWELLIHGRSGIVDVPPGRWDRRFYHPDAAVPGRVVSHRGGFVEGIDLFDAKFWGVSPREAVRMDPQQRWLLEVSWEALEDAGIVPASLEGSATGVFVGVSSCDYGSIQLHHHAGIDVHTNSGGTASIVSNRISYMLDLKGPSMSVDTACSSALTATVLACQHIWSGQCTAALAGGVNALILPNASIGFSKASMLSPSGECFAFDSRADGYVRAEGAGMVIIKPLQDALADGNRIHAVIRAAVSNQDGHTSSMTVPGVESQSAMLRQACRDAGIAPREVAYVEAHGTGTQVGDPIEARAIGNVMGQGRPPENPCLLGSVKANIGHLESGSGIAGLIKTALVLEHGVAPPSANFETPNPSIPFEELGLEVVRRARPLTGGNGPAPLAAINSFGFGGANATLVLEAPPRRPHKRWNGEHPQRPYLLPLSARGDQSLHDYAKAFRDVLNDETLPDVCWSAAERKQRHAHRAVVIGRDAQQMRNGINDLLQNTDRAETAVTGLCRELGRGGIAAVFTGQGAQWWAMGQQLLEREPLFRRTIEDIDSRLAELADWSLVEEMTRDEGSSNIDRTDIAQPAIFALQVGLTELWKSWGVVPARVVGHSVGEVAAAYGAGIYSLDDAVRVIFHRSRLQETTGGDGGGMLAVGISAAEATELIGDDTSSVQVAAINSPDLVTIAGDSGALERIESQLQQQARFVRRLRVNYAFHTHQMEPIREELLASLADIRPRPSRIPFVSTVTGGVLDGRLLDAEYWWRNVRYPVLFAPAVRTMIRGGDDLFLEIGPHPALQSSVSACLDEQGRSGAVFHSLQREMDESLSLARNAGQLHIAGVELDWAALNRSAGNPRPLPRYPWQHESFWLDQGEPATRLQPQCHPLLGIRSKAAAPAWEFGLDPRLETYLRDHQLWDSIVFPGAGYGEMGLAVARELFPDAAYVVEDLEIQKALFVSEEKPPRIRVTFDPEDKSYRVYSEPDDRRDEWDLNARGRLVAMEPAETPLLDLDALQRRLGERVGHEEFYGRFADIGFQFGPDFRNIRQAWRGVGESLCEVEVTDNVRGQFAAHVFHTALMDAGFQASWATLAVDENARPEDFFYLPSAVRRIGCQTDEMPSRVWMHCRQRSHDGKSFVCDILVADDDGRRVAEVLGFEATRMDRSGSEPWADCLYQVQWEPKRLPGSRLSGPSHLTATEQVVADVRQVTPEVCRAHGVTTFYQRYRPALMRLVNQLLENAMVELGWGFRHEDRFDLDVLIDRLGIAAQHRRLAAADLRWLTAAGLLEPDGTGWVVRRPPQSRDVRQDFARLKDEFPEFHADTELAEAVIPRLAAVMTGNSDPVEVMFPGGSSERLDRFYGQGGDLPAFNALMAEAVRSALSGLPERRAARILEVGAGTGSLTTSILKVLPPNRCDYVFTDIGPAFVNNAKTQFGGDHSFMEFRTFDLEKSPNEQKMRPASFDMILASNVLHATRDLRVTLDHLKACLAPGGMLMFLDVVRPNAFYDNTFGLLKGWWLFEDDLRTESALLPRATWHRLLQQCGYQDVQSFTSTLDADESDQAVFLAFAPREAARINASPAATSGGGQPADDETAAKPVVLLCDDGKVGTAVAKRLADRAPVITVVPSARFERLDDSRFSVRPDSKDDLGQLLKEVGEVAAVVHLWSLDHPEVEKLDDESLKAAQRTGVHSAVALIQAVVGSAQETSPDVCFVTRQAQRIVDGDRVQRFASSPLIGAVRVANNEHPDTNWVLIDLDTNDADDAADLVDEVLLRDEELETAYRQGLRYVRRATRARISELPSRVVEAVRPDGEVVPYRLETDKPGVLANLALHETSRPDPGPNEVEVRVMAGGVNFRDVMKALGIYPGNPIDLRWFGDDFSGVVQRVGNNVADLKPGDEVAGMSPYCFRAYATVNRHLLFKKPPHLSFEESATLPTVFLTAHYALNCLARMQPGERILIHAGTGGVGQAAIQIARQLGLEIFATAGSEEKRQLLRDHGVRHVMNSRTLDFADQIMEITGGQGVDAVLNSLAGEFIPKSLSVLAPFGRFLEIGKIDIYSNSKLGLERLKDNISYFVIDLAQHLERKPEMVARMFSELAERFASGDYGALTYKVFPVTEVVEAFRYMAQGKHIGKNVLSFQQSSIPIGPGTQDGQLFRDNATYLITGGAGGFGLEVAQWMAQQGARHLVLVSRSGPRDEAVAQIEHLRARGVEVADLRADVTRAAEVRRAVCEIQDNMPPLRGVVHGAMVLDDRFLAEMDEQVMNRALEPKMLGAWNLHQSTEGLPLEHFICFSSYSSIVGASRQANYNAGNVFLASMMQHRHARGLPAMTVNWGALLGAGFVERNRKTADYLEMVGVRPFQVREALEVLGELVRKDPVQIAAGRLEWSQIARFSPVVQTSPTFAGFVGGQDQGGGALRPRLLAAAPDERRYLIENFIAQQVAAVFGIETTDVDRNASLSVLGLDSLMAVELMNRVESELGLKIPMGKVLSGPSVAELSITMQELLQDHAEGTGDAATAAGSALPDGEEAIPHSIPLSNRQRFEWDAQPPRIEVCAVAIAEAPLARLQAATASLARRHPLLAASVAMRDGMPHLDLTAPAALGWEIRDFPAGSEPAEFWDACSRDIAPGGPLAKVTCLRNSDGSDLIVFAAHAVVADRRTCAMVLRELVRQTLGEDAGEDSAAASDQHYLRYMQWEHKAAGSDQLNGQITYWRELLAGAPAGLSLAALRPEATNGQVRGLAGSPWGMCPFELDKDLSHQALLAAAQRGVSVQALLQAALCTVLHAVSGQPDLLVGADDVGRSHTELSNACGPFSRRLPIRSSVQPETTLKDLLKAVAGSLQGAGENQPLTSRLSAELGLDQPLERFLPASLTMFGNDTVEPPLLSALAAGLGGGGEEIGGQWLSAVDTPPAAPSHGALSLIVALRYGQLRGWWLHRLDECPPSAVARLQELLTEALKKLISAPATEVHAALRLTSDELRRREQADTPPALLVRPSSKSAQGRQPLSNGQQALWFLYRLAPQSSAYNICDAVRVHGKLNVEALHTSLQALVDRHDAFRTTFHEEDGRPYQQVHATLPAPLSRVDASGWSAERIKRQVSEEVHRPFRLDQGPLVRMTLLSEAEDRYLLVFVVHHIIADFWSMVVCTDEFKQLYAAAVAGEEVALPPSPFEYDDFTRWQQEYLSGPASQRHWQYWSEQLAGELPVLDLPIDKPRPAEQTFNGRLIFRSIAPALAQRLKQLGERHGATMNMLLLAIYEVLLSKYTGQDDILVGIPTAGRTQADFAKVVGYFVNPVVHRGDLSDDPRAADFIAQVRDRMLAGLDHQDYPFPLLVKQLGVERDPGRTPLIQTMFVMQKAQSMHEQGLTPFLMGQAGAELRFGGLRFESLTLEQWVAQFDLSLVASEAAGGLSLALQYNTDLFHRETAQRMLAHFENLLAAVANDDTTAVSRLPMLSADECRQLQQTCNDTAHDYPNNACLHELIEAQVRKTPDACALVDDGRELTYRQLNERANQLAFYLRERGVGPEATVGICLGRSVEMIVGVLAVLKAGGAYIPVDPDLPEERKRFIMEDAGIKATLTNAEIAARIPAVEEKTGEKLVCLDSDAEAISRHSRSNPEPLADARNRAYVIYTSGSTGRPKGVEIEHRSIVNYTRAAADLFELTADDRVLQFASLSFDTAAEEIYPTLVRGATLVLRDDEMLGSVESFLDKCGWLGITVLNFPTAYWRQVTQEMASRSLALPGAVRLMIVGGERMTRESVEAWWQTVGDRVTLLNGYGPTETTVVATFCDVTRWRRIREASDYREVSIGTPIANTTAYVLDGRRRLVPLGVAGELYVGGAGLARGYLNRPELTDEAFVPSPFENGEARLYKTGDLVRRLPEGNIEYLGRADQQVKVRGFRIELGEIEALLSAQPGVREAVVTTWEDDPGQTRLAAYVVPAGDAAPASDELLAALRRRLPYYMIPSSITLLNELPLNRNRKLDLAALPAPSLDRSLLKAGFIAPRSEIELTLSQIWEEVLCVDAVGVRDNFFDLGGHSLLAVQLLSRVGRRFGRDIPLAALLRGATIEKMALMVGRDDDAPWSPLVPIQPHGDKPPLFCLHPAGGNVLCYYELAHRLGHDQPVYALQSRGVDGRLDPHDDFDAMVDEYLAAVREVQPHGPYHLCGWSSGGVTAYELARRLNESDEEIAVVALLDSRIMSSLEIDYDDESRVLATLADFLNRFYGVQIDISYDELKPLDPDDRLAMLLRRARRAGVLPEGVDAAYLRRFVDTARANMKAVTSYQPPPSDLPVHLYRAVQRLGELDDDLSNDLGWADVVSNTLIIHHTPGDHINMMTGDHAGSLAQALQQVLNGSAGATMKDDNLAQTTAGAEA